ncbi:MAG TPA: protein kinase [Planctomycetota bacterium]|nr:protein kinase [Planctomycetota bacterium]
MGPRREIDIPVGSSVILTSQRTSREVVCRIDGPLGVGGTAKVFAGTLDDGGQVVVKSPRFEGELDEGFQVEVELYKRLFHRNVIHCVGVGKGPEGQPVIAFRRAYENPLLLMTNASVVEGMLRDRKARSPSLPLDSLIDLGSELLNALEYLEELGLVHHDVKLANLMIDVAPREKPLEPNAVFALVVRREFRGVLIDFGATRARSFLEALDRGEAPPGPAPQITPLYAPPEAVVETRRPDGSLGRTFDPSLDVYAAAIVLYAMFTGHQPYSHLKEPPSGQDLESVVGAKSAERRGEVEPISLEVIQRVVLEDTRFVGGDRDAFDIAFHRFLLQRLSPDPATRGTAAAMKADFAKIMRIRANTGDGDPNASAAATAAKRVHLPFVQELVKVGAGGEHPLLRAARLSNLGEKESDAAPGARGALEPAPAPAKAATSTSRKRPNSRSDQETVRFDPSELAAQAAPAPPVVAAVTPEVPSTSFGSALSLAVPLGVGASLVVGGALLLVQVGAQVALARRGAADPPMADRLLALRAGLPALAAITGVGLCRLAPAARWLAIVAGMAALAACLQVTFAAEPFGPLWRTELSRSVLAASGLLLFLPRVRRWFDPEERARARAAATRLYIVALVWGLVALGVTAVLVPYLGQLFIDWGVPIDRDARAIIHVSGPVAEAAPAVAIAFALALAPLLAFKRRTIWVALTSVAGIALLGRIVSAIFAPSLELWRRIS